MNTLTSCLVVAPSQGFVKVVAKDKTYRVCHTSFLLVCNATEVAVLPEENALASPVHLHVPTQLVQQYPNTQHWQHLRFRSGAISSALQNVATDPKPFFVALQQQFEWEVAQSKSIPVKRAETQQELMLKMLQARTTIYGMYAQSDLHLAHLAQQSAMSLFHFSRCFKAFYSCSPYHMLKAVRLYRLAELKDQQLAPFQLAEQVGLAEPNSLYPWLKKLSKNE